MFALVDCNSFYASCEKVFRPDLQHKPVVVLSNNDGCIVARSPEAKQLGIDMAKPVFQIADVLKQHNVQVFSSNYALYGDISERVMRTLAEFVPAIEVYSIDEAFLDMRGFPKRDWWHFGEKIRKTVLQRTKIPTGIGIAPTKTLAKVANHLAKKWPGYQGVCVLGSPPLIRAVLENFPVSELWGIGQQYARRLEKFGIYTAAQLIRAHDSWLLKQLTIVGLRLVEELRGTPCLALETVPNAKKGICTSRSFANDVHTLADLESAVATFAGNCARKLRADHSCAGQVAVFLHTNCFRPDQPQYCNYRIVELPVPTANSPELIRYALKALHHIYREGYAYKKAGVMVEGIVPATAAQLDLFDEAPREKLDQTTAVMDALNQKFGKDTVFVGIQNGWKNWQLRQQWRSPRYTTRWDELPRVRCH